MADAFEEQQRVVIERLYAVFAAPVPRQITGCPCCLDTEEIGVLLRTPLRAISGNLLSPYVWNAFLTVGGVDDFRYFLPRILDVSIRHPGDAVDVEIVLGRLRLAGWDAWDDDERAAVIAAIDLLFDQAVVAGKDEEEFPALAAWEIERVLCGTARADLDPVRWLERLRGTEAILFLADLRDLLRVDPNAFWEDAPVGLQSARAWLAENLSED